MVGGTDDWIWTTLNMSTFIEKLLHGISEWARCETGKIKTLKKTIKFVPELKNNLDQEQIVPAYS